MNKTSSFLYQFPRFATSAVLDFRKRQLHLWSHRSNLASISPHRRDPNEDAVLVANLRVPCKRKYRKNRLFWSLLSPNSHRLVRNVNWLIFRNIRAKFNVTYPNSQSHKNILNSNIYHVQNTTTNMDFQYTNF